MPSKLFQAVDFLSVRGTLRAARSAPVRSLSSLAMVGRIKALGIEPGVVYDIGANRGQFASACSAFFPHSQVVAFEALPELAERLASTFKGYRNVRVIGAALGSKPERRGFYVNEYSASSSFLPLSRHHVAHFAHAVRTKRIELDIVPLDEIVAANTLPPPDLLKLDIQGFELEVLKGAERALAAARHVLLETSFRPMYEGEPLFAESYRYLVDRGFVFVGPVGFLPDPGSGVVQQMDALFERR